SSVACNAERASGVCLLRTRPQQRSMTPLNLAGALPAAALPLARSESGLAAAPSGLTSAASPGRPLTGEARAAMCPVAVRAAVARVAVSAVTIRLHPRVAAETVAALANRELRQPPLFLLAF